MAKETEKTNTVAVQPVQQPNQPSLVFDTIEHFTNAQRMCMCLSTANMLPKHFQGEQNLGNCMIALEIAQRGQLPIMEVFQNLIIVNGRVSWFATYQIGRVNSCGRYSTMTWESEHADTEAWRMRAKAVELSTGQELVGAWVSLKMARDEHWGAKWNTMPEQMLRYRSAAFWVRSFAPNISMGIKDQYEVEDITFEEVKPTPTADDKRKASNAAKAALKNALTGNKTPQTDNANVEDAQVVTEQNNAPAEQQPTEPTATPETPANAPTTGEPQPIVKVVVEPTADAQPAKPKNPYFEKAWQNLNGGQPENDNQQQMAFNPETDL